MKSESIIQKEILNYLKKLKIRARRMPTQGMYHTIAGRTFRKANPNKGMADIMVTFDNKYIWIEVKTEKGRLSPEQIQFKNEIEFPNSHYLVARSVDDVKSFLQYLKDDKNFL